MQRPAFHLGRRKPAVYWLYFRGRRYTPTGRAEDVVSFYTELAAIMFAETKGAGHQRIIKRETT